VDTEPGRSLWWPQQPRVLSDYLFAQLIDDQHNCVTMKYLRNKPVRELKTDEFLRLHLAEKEHLLEMKVTIDLEQAQDKR
jgi:transcriptional accessory protein Tex/SPT6